MEFLVVILAIGLLLAAVVSRAPSKKPAARRGSNRIGGVDRDFVATRWSEIQSKASSGALASAVSDADKLLDYALKQSGVSGETMGERLKNSGGRFSNINAIWSAHKLRNALAHEADFDLVPSMAHEAIHNFERGLRDLGAL